MSRASILKSMRRWCPPSSTQRLSVIVLPFRPHSATIHQAATNSFQSTPSEIPPASPTATPTASTIHQSSTTTLHSAFREAPRTAQPKPKTDPYPSTQTKEKENEDGLQTSSSSSLPSNASVLRPSSPYYPPHILPTSPYPNPNLRPLKIPTLYAHLTAQPPFYVTAHIHARPYLLTTGDTLRLPFLMPAVKPGDVLRLNRAVVFGSRDYTLKGAPYIDERLFVCRARVMGVVSEPVRVKEKTKRRQRRVKRIRSQHHYTVLRIMEVRARSEREIEEMTKRRRRMDPEQKPLAAEEETEGIDQVVRAQEEQRLGILQRLAESLPQKTAIDEEELMIKGSKLGILNRYLPVRRQ